MKRALHVGLALVLVAIAWLAVTQPHAMLSPGKVVPAHAGLQDDCFACHAPFRGASAARCTSCHAVRDIGVRTTRGVPLSPAGRRPAFHQALTEPDCVACHTDHPPPALAKPPRPRFDHALLRPQLRSDCRSCHVPPANDLHRAAGEACATCHQPAGWRPATFDHDRYFLLDGDHNARCTTCHVDGSFRQYTCFGCHEHREPQIVAEHREEGITNVANCVRCHRSAHGEPGGGWEHDD